MSERGRHIVLEGPDASGKKTQAKLLVEWLNAEHLGSGHAVPVAFPRYDTPFGKLVRQYLDRKSHTTDPYYASLLYAADRADAAPEIRAHLEKGDWVVCDRYVESNRAHQAARLNSEEERIKLMQWVEESEYELLGTPRPDLTILLNVPYEFCFKHAKERLGNDAAIDLHEGDENHLRLAWEQYQTLARGGGWPVISCVEGGALLPREVIAQRVREVVLDLF